MRPVVLTAVSPNVRSYGRRFDWYQVTLEVNRAGNEGPQMVKPHEQ